MKREKGFGIVAAIFVILILSMLTIFSVSLFSTDIQISLDSMRSAQALFLCEGAMNYCIKHEILGDADWSDNADTIDKPLGRGTISIYYDPNRTPTKATVRVVARVDSVTRQLTRSFGKGSWPRRYEDYPYTIHTAGDLTFRSTSYAILPPFTGNDPACPNMDSDLNYFYTVADVRKGSGWSLAGDANQVYNGICHVTGNVSFQNCKNLTFYGTLAATGSMTFSGCNNIKFIPSGDNPALVSGSNIIFNKSGSGKSAVPCRYIDVQGTMFSQGYTLLDSVDGRWPGTIGFKMKGIMYAETYIEMKDTADFFGYGSLIARSYIEFDTCSININWDSKVLADPPGISWGGGEWLDMGTWNEVY